MYLVSPTILFTATFLFFSAKPSPQPCLWSQRKGEKGLTDMIVSAIGNCEPALQKAVVSNIVVVGGSAKIPGIRERLVLELFEKLPPTLQESIDNVRVFGDGDLVHT